MKGADELTTLDTNVAVYALTTSAKTKRAGTILGACDFLSVQVLNEFANVAIRKRRRSYAETAHDLQVIRAAVPRILPINEAVHAEALRIAERYQLSFYDALMLSVALSGGARTFYSEDMQHGMTIDETLRVVDPFLPGALDA